MSGKTARSCLYVSTSLTVKLRGDMMDPELAMVAITVGRPNQRRFNLISFYRQWTLILTDEEAQRLSGKNDSQSLRFAKLCSIWKSSIDSGMETVTVSDTNLSSNLLLDQHPLSPYDASHKSISKHFTDELLPRGVIIMNESTTYYSSTSQPKTIDHITSTHPMAMTEVCTTIHPESDHTLCDRQRAKSSHPDIRW